MAGASAASGADSVRRGSPHDSAAAESPPAPLLIPGRPGPGDTVAVSRADRARRQFELARSLEKSGATAAAIAAYSTAVTLDPGIPQASYRMGMLLLARGQLAPAARCFANEVAHHPENADAIRELGTALARLGQTGRAIDHLERLSRRQPRNGTTWHALGSAYLAADRPRDAEAALRRSLTLPPVTFEVHRDLGAALTALGRETEARAEYARALELAPRDPTTWFNLANMERRAGRLDSALVRYRRAEAFDSGFAGALQAQVKILRDQRRESEAVEVYRRWLRHRPDHHGARLEAVELLETLGRGDEALALARRGVHDAGEAPQTHMLLGMVLRTHGDARGAMQELRLAEAHWAGHPAEQERARRVMAGIRASASDSLRSVFAADSVAAISRARAPRAGSGP